MNQAAETQKEGIGNAYVLCLASSSSLTLRDTRTRILVGTLRTPETNEIIRWRRKQANMKKAKSCAHRPTAIPDPLVQASLDPNIFSSHELGDELAHFLDGTWCLLLESSERKRFRKENLESHLNKAKYHEKIRE